MVSDQLSYLRQWPSWAAAIEALATLAAPSATDQAEVDAAALQSRYVGARGLMVVDAVLSSQRKYDSRVLALIESIKSRTSDYSLESAATDMPLDGLPLRRYEEATIRGVAQGLRQRAKNSRLDDDLTVQKWAKEVEPIRFAPKLDQDVCVKGIALALYAYLRMLSGADAIKPDGRVIGGLCRLGFRLRQDDSVGALLIAEAAAEEVNLSRIHLDQLLW